MGLKPRELRMLLVLCLVMAALATGQAMSSRHSQPRRLAAIVGPNYVNPCTGKVPPSNPPDEMLDGFNYMNCLRRAHGVPDLKWNKTLADGAQEWASSCPQGHGDGAISEFLRSYGENMAWGYESLSAAADGWYSEIELYDFEDPPSPFNAKGEWDDKVGHMANVLWADTTTVGCGIEKNKPDCQFRGQMGNPVYVCRYSPPSMELDAYKSISGYENIQWKQLQKMMLRPLGTPVSPPEISHPHNALAAKAGDTTEDPPVASPAPVDASPSPAEPESSPPNADASPLASPAMAEGSPPNNDVLPPVASPENSPPNTEDLPQIPVRAPAEIPAGEPGGPPANSPSIDPRKRCMDTLPPADNEVQDALNYINCLRSSHGDEPLTWDLDLGRTAQEYANSCPQQSSDADVPADKRTYIENLAFRQKGLLDAIDGWYATTENFDFTDPPDSPDIGAAIYAAALLWRSTSSLGCGIFKSNECFFGSDPEPANPFFVCRFSPPALQKKDSQTWRQVFLLELKPLGTAAPP